MDNLLTQEKFKENKENPCSMSSLEPSPVQEIFISAIIEFFAIAFIAFICLAFWGGILWLLLTILK